MDPWQQLTALARSSPSLPPEPDAAADARFADRVVDLWLHPPRAAAPSGAGWVLPWELWSLRGVAVAGAMAAVMLAWNIPLLNADTTPTELLPPDPVAELAAAF